MSVNIGIDVSKLKVDIATVDANGVLKAQFPATINCKKVIMTQLVSIINDNINEVINCAIESTSTYHFAARDACVKLGISCRIINPIITKQGLKSTIRGKKTDKTDAILIARLGLRGEGLPYRFEPYSDVKYLNRTVLKLTNISTSLKLFTKHTNVVIPDKEINHVSDLEKVDDLVRSTIKIYRKTILENTDQNLLNLLKSIPGIGDIVATSLIGEIQDITRFNSIKQLTAYTGLDPKIRQSGHTLNKTGSISKRGSPHLRRNLFLAANIARIHDDYFKEIYNKKRAEGKKYTPAIMTVSRKLLAVTYSVWKRNSPYKKMEIFIKSA